MISNQIMQSTIDGIKTITKVDLCITDTDGKEVATTEEKSGDYSEDIREFVASSADFQEIQGKQYFKVYDEATPEYVLVVIGGDGEFVIGKMIAFQIQTLVVAYKERFDKDNFIKNLLLDNLLLVDVYSRSKKLHIESDVMRCVIIVETEKARELNALETIKTFIGSDSRDFVTEVDEHSVIIVKDVSELSAPEELHEFNNDLLERMTKQKISGVRISYGNFVKEIKDVSRSYKEAKMALDVGRIFFEGEPIISYAQLGIGRLIYQLPLPLCKMFIKEIFGGRNPEDFDEETIATIDKFFENNLNVSETSRQLFIHRNTLVYRLDKLQKTTGLDLRVFEDAITFKIALMVVKYMNYMENNEY